jgi:tetratricopeptide (TPR) repeat protein
MKSIQKAVVLILLAVAVVLAVFMYWSQHLTYKAIAQGDIQRKMALLEKAAKFWIFNDKALYELGKARFDFGFQNLEDAARGKENIQKSAQSFVRSLRLNPGNFYGHYNYAHALFHLDYLSPSEEIDFVQEYRKAAMLTGHHSEIYFEVGKVLFSRWEMLSEEDQRLAIEILHNIAGRGNSDQFQSIMHTWEMNVGDYEVMRQILPDNPGMIRIYAQFLGEKSLDRRERLDVLAIAEQLDFQRAREEFSRGENHFRYYRPREAEPFYKNCLNILGNIKFYQGMTGKNLVDADEYVDMSMEANLKLAKCGILQGRGLMEVEVFLRNYLGMSDRVADASELENYLVEKRLLGKSLERSLNDLGLLNFHCYLYFKQNQYRDIKNIGSMLERSFVVVPEEDKKHYVDVLRWVAESHQITGYFYDAMDVFNKALELDENDMATLLGMRRNFERLNNEREIARIDLHLNDLLSPREIVYEDETIGKGQRFTQPMILDGSTISLQIDFADVGEDSRVFPLVSIEFNGHIVWEDYLQDNTLVLLVESQEGDCELAITSVNRPLKLKKITRR